MTGPFAAGVAALRRFYRPFLLIQAAAVLLVVAYQSSGAVRAACAALATLKARGGLPFAAVSTAIAGGVLPEIARLIADRGRRGASRDPSARTEPSVRSARGTEVPFNIAFFALNGVVIDLLYRLEARLFGTRAAIGTVIEKACFDQFVFNPVWLPLIVALYSWRSHAFSISSTARSLRTGHFYRDRVLPLMFPAWCFWIPMVSIIYAVPVPLQFLLFVPALAAWSLIMVFIADSGSKIAAPLPA